MGSGTQIVSIALLLVLGACARLEPSRMAAGEPPPGMRSVFVTGHGIHTGIAVRSRDVPEQSWPARSDFPDARFLEVGWGDREYYPREDPGLWLALRALVVPTTSVVQVRPIPGALGDGLPGVEIVELRVSDSGLERLVAFVRSSHELDAQPRGVVVSDSDDGARRFYASPLPFHAWRNCNVWVAQALHAAGLPVEPARAVTSGMLMRQVRELHRARELQRAAQDTRSPG